VRFNHAPIDEEEAATHPTNLSIAASLSKTFDEGLRLWQTGDS
jgi:hypothetical protein